MPLEEGIMGTKKSVFFLFLLVFICLGLLCFGCNGEDEDDNDKPDQDQPTLLDEQEYYDLSIGYILGKIKGEGPSENPVRARRSLARHIIRDHAMLRVYFQNQQFCEMAAMMGDYHIRIDEKKMDIEMLRNYWKNQFDLKFDQLSDEEKDNFYRDFEISLKISIDDIVLNVLSEPQEKEIETYDESCNKVMETVSVDCFSTEFLTIAVYLRDVKNDKIISNYTIRGEWDRAHSRLCPWLEP